mmetsp:Transcript_21340/g.45419  ORF Transcript_21340/g.45419 Transcript_21340/m.45419 type:complete len:548 (-) Transcript_21340:115-1758(-)
MLCGSWSFLAASLLVTFLRTAAGHNCADGSRVTCLAVQSPDAKGALRPNAYGHGFNAQGVAQCTPTGKKVYCLVDHDYHQCSQGQAPCCADGSDPNHGNGHSHEDPNDGAMCGNQIVLDDMDTTIGSEMSMAYEGSFRPCQKDAYNQQFHHDWGNNKGMASFSFKFDPPKSGCYKIEEHHPGSDVSCSRYLPSNTRLDVAYCRGRSTTFYVNQAINGGQWTEVGSLPFFKGSVGRLTLKNSGSDQCTAQGQGEDCFWVADALRLTWTGSQCGAQPVTQSPTAALVVTTTTVAEMASSDIFSQPWSGREGVVLLRASLGNGQGSDEVLMKLEAHQSIIAATVAAHLGHRSVEIKAISVSGRRLAINSDSTLFEIRYAASEKIGDPAADELKQELQTAFDAAGVGVVVQSAEVSWLEPELSDAFRSADKEAGGDDDSVGLWANATVVTFGSVFIVLSLVIIAFMVRRAHYRKTHAQATEAANQATSDHQEDLEVAVAKDNEVVGMEAEKKETGDGMEIVSVSTDEPPASEEGVGSEVSSPTAGGGPEGK